MSRVSLSLRPGSPLCCVRVNYPTLILIPCLSATGCSYPVVLEPFKHIIISDAAETDCECSGLYSNPAAAAARTHAHARPPFCINHSAAGVFEQLSERSTCFPGPQNQSCQCKSSSVSGTDGKRGLANSPASARSRHTGTVPCRAGGLSHDSLGGQGQAGA